MSWTTLLESFTFGGFGVWARWQTAENGWVWSGPRWWTNERILPGLSLSPRRRRRSRGFFVRCFSVGSHGLSFIMQERASLFYSLLSPQISVLFKPPFPRCNQWHCGLFFAERLFIITVNMIIYMAFHQSFSVFFPMKRWAKLRYEDSVCMVLGTWNDWEKSSGFPCGMRYSQINWCLITWVLPMHVSIGTRVHIRKSFSTPSDLLLQFGIWAIQD